MQISSVTKQQPLVVRIGGVCISFDVPIPEMAKKLRSHYKEYIYKGRPHIRIHVEYKDSLKAPNRASVFLSTESWQLGRNNGSLFLYFPRGMASSIARFDQRMLNITFCTSDASGQLLLYLFPHMLFRLLAIKGTSLMLHAAGILAKQRAYLFVAHSGGGKSTLATLSLKKGMTVLNDDRIIIRKEHDVVKIFGNPWHGEVEKTSPKSASIRDIFFIKKSKFNRVIPMSKRDALIQMLRHSFSLPITNDMVKKRLAICSSIIKRIRCYYFCFSPDQTVWHALDSFLNRGGRNNGQKYQAKKK